VGHSSTQLYTITISSSEPTATHNNSFEGPFASFSHPLRQIVGGRPFIHRASCLVHAHVTLVCASSACCKQAPTVNITCPIRPSQRSALSHLVRETIESIVLVANTLLRWRRPLRSRPCASASLARSIPTTLQTKWPRQGRLPKLAAPSDDETLLPISRLQR
jgi:hypothetical protein